MLYLQMIKFKIHEKDNRFIVWLEKCSPPRPIMVMLNLNFSSDLNVFLFFWARLKPIVFDQIITKDYCSGWELLRKAYKLDKIICWSFVRIFASCSASFFGFEWIFDVQYLNFFFLWQPYLIKGDLHSSIFKRWKYCQQASSIIFFTIKRNWTYFAFCIFPIKRQS